jgi:hypothetical protein
VDVAAAAVQTLELQQLVLELLAKDLQVELEKLLPFSEVALAEAQVLLVALVALGLMVAQVLLQLFQVRQ